MRSRWLAQCRAMPASLAHDRSKRPAAYNAPVANQFRRSNALAQKTAKASQMTAPQTPPGRRPRAVGMTGDELADIASEAIGYGWQAELARNLGVNKVTISRWRTNDLPISRAMAIAILCVCRHDLEQP